MGKRPLQNERRGAVIQNVADPRQNGRIGKVFDLAEPHFRRNMERNFRI